METPPLVLRALSLAEELGLEASCTPEQGAFLHLLAARRGILRAGETGTGAGVGAAWIVSALPPQTPFFSAGAEPEIAARVRQLFADDPNVTVATGAWRGVLPPEAPFDLLFVDAEDAKGDVDAVLGILAPGGTAVLDGSWHGSPLPDSVRDTWLRHPLLTATEIWVTPERGALLAVRR
jgi:predicted O-methyltransferase YrrM